MAVTGQDERLDDIGERLRLYRFDSQDMILLLEALLEKEIGIVESGVDLAERELVFTPREKDHGEEEHSSHEIDEDTTDDDTETLPCVLGTELPRLWFGRKLGSGFDLIDHAGDSTIATERNPTESPLGVIGITTPVVLRQLLEFFLGHRAVDGLAGQVLALLAMGIELWSDRMWEVAREETYAPTTVDLLSTDDRESGVEEHIELLDTYLEETCEKEVSQLVNRNEYTEGEDEL